MSKVLYFDDWAPVMREARKNPPESNCMLLAAKENERLAARAREARLQEEDTIIVIHPFSGTGDTKNAR